HGFVEGSGMTHFKYDPSMDDTELYEKGYNRVYDTLELEKNLDDAQLLVEKALERIPVDAVLSSRSIHRELGRLLSEQRAGRGIFTIGGGVPRNWAQQVGPYVDLMAKRIGEETSLLRFQYAVRICPEPVHWGGLSGCTYSEGVSWGKFVPPEEGGRFCEVLEDATVAWPLVAKAVFERLDKKPAPEKRIAVARTS